MEHGRKDSQASGQEARQPDTSKDMCPEDCPVCFEGYNSTTRRPHVLPCGHNFCYTCIDNIMTAGYAICPTCRHKHGVPEAGHFPVCYVVEDLIKKVKEMKSAAAANMDVIEKLKYEKAASAHGPSTPMTTKDKRDTARADRGVASGLSKVLVSLLEEQKEKILSAIASCQEFEEQLEQYSASLLSWCREQQHLEDRLQVIIDQSKSARERVLQEETRATDVKGEVTGQKQTLRLKVEEVEATRTPADAVIDNAAHSTDETMQKMQAWQTMFPDTVTAHTMKEVVEVTRAAVEAVEVVRTSLDSEGAAAGATGGGGSAAAAAAAGGGVEETSLTPDPASTITERLNDLLNPSMTVDGLRCLTHPVKSLVDSGRVFAVHQVQGERRRCARVTHCTCNGQLFLHSLQCQTLPRPSYTVQVQQLLPSSPPCVVFLDLAWPGSAKRRVLIRVSQDTPLGQQFILLCTGQRGPSYTNTRLLRVVYKGRSDEYVWGGDYETNNGRGGAALLPHTDNKGKHGRSGRAGTVCGCGGDHSIKGGQFGINTRDSDSNRKWPLVFGEVIEGLSVVREAAQYMKEDDDIEEDDTEQVTVVDCGLVLWQE